MMQEELEAKLHFERQQVFEAREDKKKLQIEKRKQAENFKKQNEIHQVEVKNALKFIEKNTMGFCD